jgi:hypothetical protein
MLYRLFAPVLDAVPDAAAVRSREFGVKDKVKFNAGDSCSDRIVVHGLSLRVSQFPRALMGASSVHVPRWSR